MAAATGPEGRIVERDIQALAVAGQRVTPAALPGLTESGVSSGTGLGGRIRVADIDAAAQNAGAHMDAYEDIKLSHVRKVIAKSMTASLANMAQLSLHAAFDATQLLALRARFKADEETPGLRNITLNDMVLYAVARTLKKPEHKELNAHLLDDALRCFHSVNLGFAVDTPRGLLVPTLFGADTMSLCALSGAGRQLSQDARDGTILPDLLGGGTFTVSNLGSLGVEYFTPIINPPQTAILGVGTLTDSVKNVEGQPAIYKAMGLSLTFDHRAVDGAPAARFLQALGKALENFPLLLAR